MEEKEFQILFTKNIKGNSIIQLKDGKILFFDFYFYNNIYIYNEKTFQQLYEVELYELITKYEKEKRKKDNLNNEEAQKIERRYHLYGNKLSIKEINDGLVLIGFNKYLLELKIKKKTFDCKIIKKFNDIISELNVLRKEKIIIITTKNIFILNKNKNEYIIKEEFLIKENWKTVNEYNKHIYGHYNNYFISYVLPNNRLLLNSFSKGYYFRFCGNAPRESFSIFKIIFCDLKNFEEISSTETFYRETKFIVLKNNIIIQVGAKNFIIYDINSLKIVKKIYLSEIYENIEKIYD